jgi:integrase
VGERIVATVRLTNAVVEAATCPKGGDRREWWDAISTGLVLRVTERGSKTWYAIYRSPVTGKQTKMRLGDVKVTEAENGLTLADARSANIRVQSEVDSGRDPRVEREKEQAETRRQLDAERFAQSHATVQAMVDDYLANKQGIRPSTLEVYRSAFDREILPAIGTKPVRDVTALDLELIVSKVAKRGKRARARNVKTTLGSVWGWARRTAKWRELGVTRDLVSEINPELTTKGAARKRKLTDHELRHFWQAIEASNLTLPTKIAFKLTILLGERSTELIEAPWSEIEGLEGNAPRWALPAARNKGKSDKVLPLPPMAAELMRELRAATGKTPWLIPARGRNAKLRPAHPSLLTGALRQLRSTKLLSCAHFTPHDLRRTMANRMSEELGVSDEAIKGVLGHARSDVTSVHYTQSQQLPAKLAALTAWERRVREIAGLEVAAETNVVELKRTAS